MRNYRNLLIWQRSYKYTLSIYKITKTFPKDELYSLVNQIRRSSSSISANIAEGCGKSSKLEFQRYLEHALSSAYETENHLLLSKDLDYVSEEDYKLLENELNEIIKMISSYMRELKLDIKKA
jgi:four helix bundle protein